MLAFSKHDVFCSTTEGHWTRTGTDPDGNCFFNAYAYSIQPTAYREMDPSRRKQYVMKIKHYFANKITQEDTFALIDVSFFEVFLKYMSSMYEPQYTLPDLSKQPLQSMASYVQLLSQTHPSLVQDPQFTGRVHDIAVQYHRRMEEYIRKDGTWMFDALIPLFMKKMEVNVMIISHDTKLPITHYPLFDYPETIVMYHIGEHFESVGFYKQPVMQRVFPHASFP